MKTEEEIKELEDKELLELEHDTEVDLLDLVVGTDCSVEYYLELSAYNKALETEIEARKLEKLPRLNGI